MSATPTCLTDGATVGLALALLVRERREAVPVIDAAGAVVGLLDRERFLAQVDDLRRRSPDGRSFHDVLATSVADAIDRAPVGCAADTVLADACALLERAGACAALVVRDGQLQGLLTRADVIRAVAAEGERRGLAPATGAERVVAACREVEPPPESVLEAEHAGAEMPTDDRPPRHLERRRHAGTKGRRP